MLVAGEELIDGLAGVQETLVLFVFARHHKQRHGHARGSQGDGDDQHSEKLSQNSASGHFFFCLFCRSCYCRANSRSPAAPATQLKSPRSSTTSWSVTG